MTQDTLLSALESLLFMSGEPLLFARISKIAAVSEVEVKTAIDILAAQYRDTPKSGLMILTDDVSVTLVTKPVNAPIVEQLVKSTLQENLSRAALEVLAIVAYRSPVSRAEVDAIRGVNGSFTLRNLLLRDLISREGSATEGRGYRYRPTLKFLETLGMEKISDLPDYQILSQDERLRVLLEQETGGASEDSSEPNTP